MKVCVMTAVHSPDDVRINKEIKTLIKGGYEVVYIAPEGDFKPKGFKYVPIKKYTSRRERFLRSRKEILGKALEVDADIYHFHDPELIPVGLKLKKLGKKVIYDVHEDYPASILTKQWIPAFLRKIISRLFDHYEKASSKKFDGLVVVNNEVAKRFQKEKIVTVPNYPDIHEIQEIQPKRLFDRNNVVFIYTGSIDEDRAIEEMLEAFEIASKKVSNISFAMIGPIFSQRLKGKIQSYQKAYKGKFVYMERKPYKEAMSYVKGSDIGLVIYRRYIDNTLLRNTINSVPNKLFEYPISGIPIIASNFEKWRRYLEKFSCALFVNPHSPEEIARAMVKLATDAYFRETLKKNALKVSIEYSWQKCEREILSLYTSL